MKRFLTAIAAVFIVESSYGQGQVNFNNYSQNGGAGAPIYFPPVTAPNNRIAGLYTVVGGVETLQATAPFYTTPGADFLISLSNSQSSDGTVTLTGIPENTTGVNFIIKAWDRNFASYDGARAGGGSHGSQAFTGDVGPLNLPANNLVNFTGFIIMPEPSTIAFGIIGGLALLFCRRK